jgi:uncharacterized membrane protein
MGTEEIYTLDIVKLPIMGIITNFDYTPPVYNLLAHFSYLLFNGYDVAIRYPAVVAGILLIPAAFYLGKEYHSELVGLYLSFFTVVILPFEYYSQYARSYILSVLFFTLFLIYYIRIKRNTNTKNYEFIFWSLAAVNVWVHLFSIIPVALLCLDILIEKKNVLYATLSCILIVPLLNIFKDIISTRNASSGFTYGASALQMIFLLPLEFFNVLFMNVIALFFVGFWIDKDKLKIPLLICAIITLIIGVVTAIVTPVFPRYLMDVEMVFLLLAAIGCVKIAEIINEKIGKNLNYIILIVIILIFTWMAIPNFESHFFVQQYV